MTFGNVAALASRNLYRILAYSSIAHVGYLMLATTAALYHLSLGDERDTSMASYALTAALIHLTAYALSKPGTLLIIGEGPRGSRGSEVITSAVRQLT